MRPQQVGATVAPPRGRGAPVRLVALAAIVALAGSIHPVGAQEADSDDLERELDRAEDEADDLASELGDVRSAIEQSEAELAQIQMELQDARGRLQAAEGQVALAEAALAEAEEEREEAVQEHEDAQAALEATEAELEAEEALLVEQLVQTFKHGTSGAQRGAMAMEVLQRAEDPTMFAHGMQQLKTVVDAQDRTVQQVFALREEQADLAEQAAVARARASQAEDEAETTLATVEELREEAAQLTAEVEEQEEAEAALLASLEADEEETEAMLVRVAAQVDELEEDLAEQRAREEEERQAQLEAERAAQAEAEAEAEDGNGSSAASGSSQPGASGGPAVDGLVCPVQGAAAGRDFTNDWGYPRAGGRYHQGNDIFAARGTPVVAVDDGEVIRMNGPSSPTSLGGITVTYRTADGSEWYNAHLDSVANGISVGASVSRGDRIGTVGDTGNARGTPPHLHLGRRYGGSWVNPWPTISPVC